jgi:hypothetical protein
VLPGDIKVEVDPLQLRFDFHKESVLLTDYSKSGSTRTKLVSALDVAHALASELDLSSGVLPPDCLWFSKTAGGSRVAIWCPAQVWHVSVKLDIDDFRKLKLPMPGLVFICQQGWQSPFRVRGAQAAHRQPRPAVPLPDVQRLQRRPRVPRHPQVSGRSVKGAG